MAGVVERVCPRNTRKDAKQPFRSPVIPARGVVIPVRDDVITVRGTVLTVRGMVIPRNMLTAVTAQVTTVSIL